MKSTIALFLSATAVIAHDKPNTSLVAATLPHLSDLCADISGSGHPYTGGKPTTQFTCAQFNALKDSNEDARVVLKFDWDGAGQTAVLDSDKCRAMLDENIDKVEQSQYDGVKDGAFTAYHVQICSDEKYDCSGKMHVY